MLILNSFLIKNQIGTKFPQYGENYQLHYLFRVPYLSQLLFFRVIRESYKHNQPLQALFNIFASKYDLLEKKQLLGF
jgi:hypothetical protein